jgi:AcrR family transcriptional regulator
MQQRSEETRNRIIEAANMLFSKHGYDSTGVAEICEAAGVSKGAFYHHFPSKQALFLAEMETWLSGVNQIFSQTRQQARDVPTALMQMAELAGGIFQNADVRSSILLEFWVQAYRDPLIWQKAIAPYRRYQSYFAEMIQEGIDQGSLRPVDAHLSSRTLVSLAFGLLMQALFDPTSTDWQAEARESVELVLEGIARRES